MRGGSKRVEIREWSFQQTLSLLEQNVEYDFIRLRWTNEDERKAKPNAK